MPKILLVDASPLMFRTFSGPVRGFSTSSGEPTGLRFGFLRGVRAMVKAIEPEKTVVVYDAHRSEHIAEMMEGVDRDVRTPPEREFLGASRRGYKGNRETDSRTAQMIWGGLPKLREMLCLTEYAQAWAPGFEADDVIAALARTFSAQGARIVVASPDRDLWQLFTHDAVVGWDQVEKKYVGPKDAMEHFGVPVLHLHFWRAVDGDPSDNLRGIPVGAAVKGGLKSWFRSSCKMTREDCLEGGLGAYSLAIGEAEQKNRLPMGTHDTLFGERRTRDHLKSNYELMTLLTPKEIQLVRGERNCCALEALFKSLEMKSLIPKVREFTGPVVGLGL